jgi:type IX secretion system PorP/SprF family membrane protein
MKPMKYLSCLALIFLLIAATHSDSLAQQRFQFSQYMFNGLVLNPAYAGTEEALSLTFYNRSQWNRVDGAPTTQTFSAHTLFAKQHIGTGLTVVKDEIGAHQNLTISAATAYHLRVANASFLSFGIQGGFSHRESDYRTLSRTDLDDPKVSSHTLSQNLLDLGAGIYFRSPKVHLGLSVPQLLPGKVNINDSISVDFNKTQAMVFSKVHFDFLSNIFLLFPFHSM